MQVLIDTDAFCKLAVSGLLNDAVRLLGTELTRCGRLPALPYMLRGGSLRRRYGPENCDNLIPIVDTMPIVESSGNCYLDQLVAIPQIDPGEAQLLARAAETDSHLLTGDKRSIRALNDLPHFGDKLAGRIVVFDAMLVALCSDLGLEDVNQRIRLLNQYDKVVMVID